MRITLFGAVATGTVLLFSSIAGGCRREPKNVTVSSAPPPAHVSFASTDCRSCHEEIFQSWSTSHHALAHRPVNARADGDAFVPGRDTKVNGIDYHLEWKDDRPSFTEKRDAQPPETYSAEFVLGHTPLRQYVVPVGGGRYQAPELTFDPAKKEWFNVFGEERREPSEWRHWRGRAMNWNSMCAHCHL